MQPPADNTTDSQNPESVYADPAVRRRFSEFLGGESLDDATAAYVTHADGSHLEPDSSKSLERLSEFLDHDEDLARSLMDDRSVLVHLDIEYIDFDSPAACYLDPLQAFGRQQPVIIRSRSNSSS